jgi:hypothetical protein
MVMLLRKINASALLNVRKLISSRIVILLLDERTYSTYYLQALTTIHPPCTNSRLLNLGNALFSPPAIRRHLIFSRIQSKIVRASRQLGNLVHLHRSTMPLLLVLEGKNRVCVSQWHEYFTPTSA